ncbi:MAG: helix-turn-helix domain-containing protein [Vulcanimicrobiaceae bacterium]
MLQYEKRAAPPQPAAVPDVLRRRAVPTFYVVDKALRVVVACGSPTMEYCDALPPSVERIVRNLIHRVKHQSESALAMDGDTVVRIIKPYAVESELTCVIIEKLRTRNPLGEAVERHGMTSRQAEVLKLLMQGAPNMDIAAQLHIAASTVEDHVRNIAAKTDAQNRSQIVARVLGFL